jgi:hypothetical protein
MGLFFLQTSLFSVYSTTTPYIIIRSLLSITYYCITQKRSPLLPTTTKVYERRTRVPSSLSSIEPSGIPFLVSSNLRTTTTTYSSSPISYTWFPYQQQQQQQQ